MNKILKITISIIISLFFISCATDNLSISSLIQPKTANKQPVVSDNIFDMPRDAYKVVLAIGSKIIKKRGNYRDVVLQSPYQSNFKEAALFTFEKAVLISYSDNLNTNSKMLKADIYFIDSLKRKIAYTINANYLMKNSKIIVNNYTVSDKFLATNRSICFIVPADKYKNIFFQKKDVLESFYMLYEYAAKNAVTPNSNNLYNIEKNWAILVFFMNRMSKSATVQLGIGDNTNKYDLGYTKDSKYINFDGWRVATVVGKFQLLSRSSKKSLFAKAFFTPGKEYTKNILTKASDLVGLCKIK